MLKTLNQAVLRRRMGALLTGAFLATGQVYGQLVTADRESIGPPTPRQYVLAATQQQLSLPPQSARVVDAQWDPAQGYPQFILIQDVHNHPEAQAHIAAIILHGYRCWGVRKVFLEGAFAPVDLSVFHRIPDETRAELLRGLIKDGSLSGPEVAAVLVEESEWRNPPVTPFQLIGLELPPLYAESLAVYGQLRLRRPQALSALATIRRLQTSLHLPVGSPLPLQLGRLEDLLRLKLTPTEYAAYLQAPSTIPSCRELDSTRRLAEHFYALVQERSRRFIARARQRYPASSGPRILVVGGFHTELMAQELRARGLSFVVLRPPVTQPGYDFLYERRMEESVKALEMAQALRNGAVPRRASVPLLAAKN